MKIKHYQVISNYESAYPDPLVFSKGEMLKIGTETSDWPGWVWCTNENGKSGWTPRSYIAIYEKFCKALKDYNASEITVKVGQTLVAEKEESGWIWVTNKTGKSGWIPLKNVKKIKKNLIKK
jgi:uncharacterized protein YgiM (DUF1202 family)